MRMWNMRWFVLVFGCAALMTLSSKASAQNVPFKVYITGLTQLDTGFDPIDGPIADFYAKVTINGVQQDNKNGSGACNDGNGLGGIIVPFPLFNWFQKISECNLPTPWVFTQMVPAGQPVHVHIEIWDFDSLTGDDQADIKVGPGNALDFVVDPSVDGGKWGGDINWPQDCSRPDNALGGSNANMCFQMGFDSDDDGLLDVWEQFGVDTDNDGVIDLDLASMGANPLRKDVFVESDFLQAANHTHAPNKSAIVQIVQSFANSPVQNPDGTTGVQLHVDTGSQFGAGQTFSLAGPNGVTGTYGDMGGGGTAIPEAGNEIIDGFGKNTPNVTQFADLKKANFDPKREPIFRYLIWGHQTNVRAASGDCTTGETDKSRRNFMVTLGGTHSDGTPCWDTVNGFSVGTTEQPGTFMHELGHTLGLQHGGNETTNNKPNYLSVMNYSFQFCTVLSKAGLLPGGCDYSRFGPGGTDIIDLDETDLDECVGIGAAFGVRDWNGNKINEGVSRCGPIFTNVSADTNNDGICITAGSNKTLDTLTLGNDDSVDANTNSINDGPNRFCDTTAKPDDLQLVQVGFTPPQQQVLKSFNDWQSLDYSLLTQESGSGSGAFEEQEADPDTINQARQHMRTTSQPAITLSDTGPATAKPGDQLSYQVKVTNTGQGPAVSAVLQITNPDGTVQTSPLDVIKVGDTPSQTANFTVPANACPGTFTGAGASLNFTNIAGDVQTVSAASPLQILDVQQPSVSLSVTPTIIWPPNHKFVDVTATITATDNCDPNPTITLVSITSNEPETGFVQGAAFGTDDRAFQLQADRDTGHGRTGRVYTITYKVTDKSGNSTLQAATVTVPANQGN
ncbi:MAG TPA: hypothetical protein VEG30_09980 [Terriglobales bacterium]|nr:hypothetical protein [Terriglobales bacterium]